LLGGSPGSSISASLRTRSPVDIHDRLDENAALIPRMILILRKLARIREAAGRSAPLSRRNKVGRNDPCPCGSAYD